MGVSRVLACRGQRDAAPGVPRRDGSAASGLAAGSRQEVALVWHRPSALFAAADPANEVSSTGRYVAPMEPLVRNPAGQNALTGKITTEITSQPGPPAEPPRPR